MAAGAPPARQPDLRLSNHRRSLGARRRRLFCRILPQSACELSPWSGPAGSYRNVYRPGLAIADRGSPDEQVLTETVWDGSAPFRYIDLILVISPASGHRTRSA